MPDKTDYFIEKLNGWVPAPPETISQADAEKIKVLAPKLVDPLAQFMIACRLVEKADLWDQVDYYWDPETKMKPKELELATQFNDRKNEINGMLEDLSFPLRGALLKSILPRLEEQLVNGNQDYAALAYENKYDTIRRTETKKQQKKQLRAENTVFLILALGLVGILFLFGIKDGEFLGLIEYGKGFRPGATFGQILGSIGLVLLSILLGLLMSASFLTFLRGLISKAAHFFASVSATDRVIKEMNDPGKHRTEEQQWVWLCQRCQAMLPFLGQSAMECPRCHNRMTQVRGQWGK